MIELLNPLKKNILCVRGNCDTEVDQMVLDFSILSDYALISVDDVTIFATHGHLVDEQFLSRLNDNDILLCGHTHIGVRKRRQAYISKPWLGVNPESLLEKQLYDLRK